MPQPIKRASCARSLCLIIPEKESNRANTLCDTICDRQMYGMELASRQPMYCIFNVHSTCVLFIYILPKKCLRQVPQTAAQSVNNIAGVRFIYFTRLNCFFSGFADREHFVVSLAEFWSTQSRSCGHTQMFSQKTCAECFALRFDAGYELVVDDAVFSVESVHAPQSGG